MRHATVVFLLRGGASVSLSLLAAPSLFLTVLHLHCSFCSESQDRTHVCFCVASLALFLLLGSQDGAHVCFCVCLPSLATPPLVLAALHLQWFCLKSQCKAHTRFCVTSPPSQRHPSYMQRYTSTGDSHILDKVLEVVALHKVRIVFPFPLETHIFRAGTMQEIVALHKVRCVRLDAHKV